MIVSHRRRVVLTRRSFVLFFILLVLPAVLKAQSKVGYVDSNSLLTRYTPAADARQELEKLNTQWGQEMAKMNTDLKQMETDLENQSLLLSEAKRAEKREEIEAKRAEIRKYQEDKWGQNGAYFQKQTELMQPILDRINEVVHRMGEDEKYDYILDTAQGSVLYAQEGHDLTDLILDELEKGDVTTQSQRR
jgi:outer membrane protein